MASLGNLVIKLYFFNVMLRHESHLVGVIQPVSSPHADVLLVCHEQTQMR